MVLGADGTTPISQTSFLALLDTGTDDGDIKVKSVKQ